jgi:hypothetical protein
LSRSASRQSPDDVIDLSLVHVIDLPLWSTLMFEIDALWLNVDDDQRADTPPLTSAKADGSAEVITRLPASGFRVRVSGGVPLLTWAFS